MTNQDIETFFAVLDHGTMTAAAEAHTSIITPDSWNELSRREMFQRSVFQAIAETLNPAM